LGAQQDNLPAAAFQGATRARGAKSIGKDYLSVAALAASLSWISTPIIVTRRFWRLRSSLIMLAAIEAWSLPRLLAFQVEIFEPRDDW